MATDDLITVYELDHRLTISSVGTGWDQFARDNDAAELVSPAPIGRPLMSFVVDPSTVHLYHLLFQRAGHLGRLSFPLRCDGPAMRRFLEASIEAHATGGFTVTNRLIRSELRDPVALLSRDTPRDEDFLLMCGWCKRVDVGGRWLAVEEAVSALRLFERTCQPQLTHGICEACHRAMVALLEDEIPARRT